MNRDLCAAIFCNTTGLGTHTKVRSPRSLSIPLACAILPSSYLVVHYRSSCTCHSDTAVAGRNEYGCCPLQFCLLRNTPHWGKIVLTRPSALCLLFSWSQNPMDARFFQSLLTFSPVSGVVPLILEKELFKKVHLNTASTRIAFYVSIWLKEGCPKDINATPKLHGSHKTEPFSFSYPLRQWQPCTANPLHV